jgi:xylan 1,4-beta-xylosidase
MISGVELNKPSQVQVQAIANRGGNIEIWLDTLKQGKLIATVPV